LHPAIARSLIDHERRMAHAKAGMTAVFYVRLRAAKTINEKAAKAFFGAC